MDFFKTFMFLFGRNFKKLITAILFILFLTLSFFLILSNSNSVSAESYGVSGSAIPSNVISNLVNWYESNYSSSYNYFTIQYSPNDTYGIINVFNIGDSSTKIIWFSNHIESTTGTCTGEYFKFIKSSGNVYEKAGNISTYIYNSCTFNGSNPYYYSNLDLYNQQATQILWSTDYEPPIVFTAPSLYPNADSNQTTNLTSGNFIFFIIEPGSVPDTSSIQLDFFDTSSDNNGNALVQEITLNKNSAFFQYTNIEETEYQYVITARFLDWFKLINGKSYRAVLSYYDNNNQYQSITYNWTMSIDSTQQQIIADTTQQDINKGIQDMNSYLNNQNFDENSIIDNMPNVTINSATDNLLDLLFDNLRTAFTSTTPINFEFTIPNSNGQKIIIPSNYISSHLPSIIITIIQTFYWYLIARYILMDAWHTIDRMRQGTYYTGADGDIKTEVL